MHAVIEDGSSIFMMAVRELVLGAAVELVQQHRDELCGREAPRTPMHWQLDPNLLAGVGRIHTNSGTQSWQERLKRLAVDAEETLQLTRAALRTARQLHRRALPKKPLALIERHDRGRLAP